MSDGDDIVLRPATATDRPFLEQVYAESRAVELSRTEWSAAEKEAFCRSQFAAQDQHYRQHYPDCEFLVIECGGDAVGRLYRERRNDEIRVVDIALLEEARGRGTGGDLMRGILDEAGTAGLAVRIHVERDNPARRLYDRLGFELVEEGEVYDLLAWRAPDH